MQERQRNHREKAAIEGKQQFNSKAVVEVKRLIKVRKYINDFKISCKA